jgi:surface polysaccharide O-acyltransferase-like enzyme
VPLFACLLIYGGALHGDASRYGGGFNFVSLAKSAWESLVCVGASLLLVTVFRMSFDRQGPVARILSDNAFAVYVFHPPVTILLAIVMSGLDAPVVIKAVLLTVSAGLVTFSLCAVFIRRIPGLRRIL